LTTSSIEPDIIATSLASFEGGLKTRAKNDYNCPGNPGKEENALDSGKFAAALRARGYDFAAGVPCTWLGGVIEAMRTGSAIEYVGAPSEAAAVGIAAGAYLAGRTPVVLMQNNGLVNSMDVVSSLVQLYRIPLLMLVSWRGEGGDDYEEHLSVGTATTGFLKSFDIPVFAPGPGTVVKHLKVASFTSRMGKGPAALLIKKGVLE
jgi:phosphonopyruvate decarboxylase